MTLSSAAFAVHGFCVDTPDFGSLRGLGERRLIVVGKDGRIQQVEVGEAGEQRRALAAAGIPVREFGEKELLVPGFIDTHIHLPQFPYTGAGIDKPLMAEDGFLAKYAFPTESSMVNLDSAKYVYNEALKVLLTNGTTTALIYGTTHLDASKTLVEAALALQGPRAFVGKVCADRYCPDALVETTASSLRDTEDFVNFTQKVARQSPEDQKPPFLVQPVITPRFLPTCSPELLKGLGELAAKYNCIIQSHMSESVDEVAFSSQLFPGKTDAQASFNLLATLPDATNFDPGAVFVMGHCVQLQKGEEELMRQRGAAIAHCPLSNFFFAKGALPVKQLVARGVKIGLGTDVAGGYSPSMLSSMRAAVLASKTLQFCHVPNGALEKFGPADEQKDGAEHDLSYT
ncbi:Guanine deaminase [Symbiodinium microadriaticum]|uniref:Guanine deaminase n=1 Tax=Symbiodinium microadriaticum TaxID=2951 RepID=A0A1Q9ERP8_SYMMI|nr:Guanine deaminase [Symbiodinium microadriaticum]